MSNPYKNEMGYPEKTMIKLWKKVIYPEEITRDTAKDSCFGWLKPFDAYGKPIFRLEGKYIPAQKVLYQSIYGEIDDDYIILNTCRNNHCMNPHHFFAHKFEYEVRIRDGKEDPLGLGFHTIAISEYDLLRVFNGIKLNKATCIADIGKFLDIDDHSVIDLLVNKDLKFVKQYYTENELNQLRSKVGIFCDNN